MILLNELVCTQSWVSPSSRIRQLPSQRLPQWLFTRRLTSRDCVGVSLIDMVSSPLFFVDLWGQYSLTSNEKLRRLFFGSRYRNCYFLLESAFKNTYLCFTIRRKKNSHHRQPSVHLHLRLSLLFLLRLVNKYNLSVLLYSVLLHSDLQKSRVLFFRSLNGQHIYPRWITLPLLLPFYEPEILKFQ